MSAEETNRFRTSLADPFSVFTPSPEALHKIEILALYTDKRDENYYKQMYDILVEDQAKHSLRVHKGNPLYWWSIQLVAKETDKALRLMLGAFIEDVLTHGHRAFDGFAAGVLVGNFGVPSENLVDLAEFVLDKTKNTMLPLAVLDEYLRTRGRELPKGPYREVTEDTMLGIASNQVRKKLEEDLRPSFQKPPDSESNLQNVMFALLRQVDSKTEREMGGIKFAGKEFTIDFSMFDGKLGVEAKLIKERSDVGKIIDQINGDIPAYQTSFKWLTFVVFDSCNAIADKKRFVADLVGGKPNIGILVV